MAKNDKPKEKPKTTLDVTELRNLSQLVSTHPTNEGVGSQPGMVKINLVNKLNIMIRELDSSLV